MTRIESIFGSVFAFGILAIFAFVFFGGSSLPGAKAERVGAPRYAPMSLASLTSEQDGYVPPANACDCYNYAYTFAKEGLQAGSVHYESQFSICYERLGAMGAAAFERGFVDFVGEPRQRRSCRVQDYY